MSVREVDALRVEWYDGEALAVVARAVYVGGGRGGVLWCAIACGASLRRLVRWSPRRTGWM